MVNARFYYEAPYIKTKGFLGWIKNEHEQRQIENVNNLTSKLVKAKEDVTTNFPYPKEIYSGIIDFPLFYFNIENVSSENFHLILNRLFDTTSPLFPEFVESKKEGYEIIDNFLNSHFRAHLEKRYLPLGTNSMKLVFSS